MHLGAGRELVPAGVGPDGAKYNGVDKSGAPVTLYRLRPAASKAGAARFDVLSRSRIDRALVIKRIDLEANIVVVERTTDTLAKVLAAGPLPAERAVRVLHDVARALHQLHREGLTHGAVEPAAVALYEGGGAALDVTGLRCSTRADALARLCRAKDDEGDAGADVFALGALLLACLEGRGAVARLLEDRGAERTTADAGRSYTGAHMLAAEMLEEEPAWRPSSFEVVRRLAALRGGPTDDGDSTRAGAPAARAPEGAAVVAGATSTPEGLPEAVGRFEVITLLGEGAMGRVYKARDRKSGDVVALKVIPADPPPTKRALKRFRKEARILSEVNNPGVAGLVDAGEDDGRLWIAVEHVEGDTLSSFIAQRGPLPETEALGIVADLCRALVDVHAQGVVHRDIKPQNVLVVAEAAGAAPVKRASPRIKLIDFGIARHLDETESLAMTRHGAVLGTPLYMAPEQARGDSVDARSDVYAVGTILYELLTGTAPFAGHGATAVLLMQQERVAPRVTEVRPECSEEVARIVARALEKDPDARFPDAHEMLAALLRLLDEEPATIMAHPRARGPDGLSRWAFEWDLKSAPRELWPYVSNTERLNRAIGLGAVDEHVEIEDGDPVQFGHSKQAGFDLRWRELPYEWVVDRRIGVFREYSEGPMRSLRSTVDLHPAPGGGTHIVHTIEIDPRGVLGRAAAAVEMGVRTRRSLDRVYRRIDELVHAGRLDGVVDPYAPPESLTLAQRERLAQLERKIVDAGADAAVVARLGELVEHAPAQELARIRPIALARRLDLDEDAVLRACLVAGREGMLVPLWDLLCPACRGPAGIEETLRAVKDHAHCDVCNIDFALDLASSIELVFRVHPQLRQADVATYCLSSPGKSPHVLAQVRVMPGERFLLDTVLPEGSYQLVGRRLSYTLALTVRAGAAASRVELPLSTGPARNERVMTTERQEIVLHNDTGREQLVRLERTAPRNDVVTAARAAAHPLFRALYPNELLEPGALLRVGSIVLAHAELRGADVDAAGAGDPAAFSSLYAAFKAMEAAVAAEGGSVVKLLGDGLLAVFDDPAAAVRAAWALDGAVRADQRPAGAGALDSKRASDTGPAGQGRLRVRAAVHRGPAAAVTLNDRLDYFGACVREVAALAGAGGDGSVLVSDDVLTDPVVQALLDERAEARTLPGVLSEEPTGPFAIA